MPRRRPSGLLMRPPRTRSPLSLPRGTNRLTRLVPAWHALTRASSEQDAVPLRVRSPVAPCALRPCRATGALGSGRNRLAASLRTGLFCATRETSFWPIRTAPSPRAEAFRPTGKEKRRDALPRAEEGRNLWTIRGDSRPSRRACAASELPPSLGHIFLGSRPQNARRVRREFHKPLPEARARTARQHLHAAPSLGHNGSAPRIVKKYSCV